MGNLSDLDPFICSEAVEGGNVPILAIGSLSMAHINISVS